MHDLGVVPRPSGLPRPPATTGRLILSAFLLVCLVVSSLVVVTLHARSNLSSGKVLRPAQVAVIFVISGATGTQLNVVSDLPHLAAMAKSGMSFRQAWVGQYETVPIASDASIASGVTPNRHGILGDVWQDPGAKYVIHPDLQAHVQNGSLDQIMESRGLATLAASLKARQPRARILAVGGEGCAAADALGTWLADYVLCPVRHKGFWRASDVTGHVAPGSPPQLRTRVFTGKSPASRAEGWKPGQQDRWIARYTAWAIRRTHPRLIMVDFPELATLGSEGSPARRSRLDGMLLKGVDQDIGTVLSAIRSIHGYHRTVEVVTSDVPLQPIRRELSLNSVRATVLGSGGQINYLAAGGSAVIGLQNILQAEPAAQALGTKPTSRLDAVDYKTQVQGQWRYRAAYLKPDVPARFSDAISFLLGTLASAGSPEVVVVGGPGVGMNLSDRRRGSRVSMFGLQWSGQHIPLIISGYGVTSGASRYPARLVDIAPTIEALLGLTPVPGSGVVLANSLVHPPPRAVALEALMSRRLLPLVHALKKR